MCGILGILPAVNESVFKSALDKIQHRGPDGWGIWTGSEGKVCFGHRRLSILDTSAAGAQPMHYMHYTIIFNGEIYNFIEVRADLKKQGYEFTTECDTEVIMAAYDHWGVRCLDKFNGMWSFAIWDNKKQQIFLARDRFGKKPLFYSCSNGYLSFGSEMKALTPFLKNIEVSNNFNLCVEDMFNYEQTSQALIKDIYRFPAGHYAIYNSTNTVLVPVKYWNTMDNLVKVPKNYNDQVEEFRELFVDACKIRMRADVPIGTALSGGLDSSATICTMAEIAKKNYGERVSHDWQHAFVACFKGSFLDERVYAEKVVDHLGIPATYLEIDPVSTIGRLYEDMYMFEELYITSPIPMMETYKAVKQHGVSVTIDGHGADELLAGYGKQMLIAFMDCGLNLKEVKDVMDTFYGTQKISGQNVKREITWREYYRFLFMQKRSRGKIMKYYARHLLNNKKEDPQNGKFGYFNKALYTMYHKDILPTLLRNYDRYSMANSVEIRMPFMDHRLASFCFSLPWQSKLGHGYTKRIMRDALRPFMPKDIVNRKSKIGFNTPITEWMKGPWKEYFMDHIHSTAFLNCPLGQKQDAVEKVNYVINSPSATFQDGESAWMAMTPYFWYESFFKRITND